MDSSDLRNQLDEVKGGSKSDKEPPEQPDEDMDSVSQEEDATTENATDETVDKHKGEEAAVDEGDDADEPDGGPWFTSSESDKTSIYPHKSNSRFITVLCNAVENDLLALGYDDFEKREAHDAMVQLAHQNPREVTRIILESRGLDPDDVDRLS